MALRRSKKFVGIYFEYIDVNESDSDKSKLLLHNTIIKIGKETNYLLMKLVYTSWADVDFVNACLNICVYICKYRFFWLACELDI